MQSIDQKLLRKALSGRGEAWERLVRRHEKGVYNFALRMVGNREDALDLMQEIFLSVYRSLGTYTGSSAFSTWLFAIASRRAADYFRRKGVAERFAASDAPEAVAHGPSPLSATISNETNGRLLALLARLPPEQRLVLELKFFRDQTFEEMSHTLGVSTNTLKTRFYTALKKVRAMPEAAHVV